MAGFQCNITIMNNFILDVGNIMLEMTSSALYNVQQNAIIKLLV